MKKILFYAVVAAASVLSVLKATETSNNNKMSDLQLENIQLLAEGEITWYLGCMGNTTTCSHDPIRPGISVSISFPWFTDFSIGW